MQKKCAHDTTLIYQIATGTWNYSKAFRKSKQNAMVKYYSINFLAPIQKQIIEHKDFKSKKRMQSLLYMDPDLPRFTPPEFSAK